MKCRREKVVLGANYLQASISSCRVEKFSLRAIEEHKFLLFNSEILARSEVKLYGASSLAA